MLTEKEIEVLKLRKKGLTQIEISKKLKITQPAVSKFCNNVIKKIKQAEEIIEIKKEIDRIK
jgi:transcriptional regulator